MKKFEVANHEPSYLPEGKWNLVWSDEFDGPELDRTKWDFRLNIFGKRHRTWNENEGINFDGNSNIVMSVYEKDGEICSPHLQTGQNFMDQGVTGEKKFMGGLVWPIGKFKEPKFLHRYGYYECRCKLQKREGWWSAFWLQSPIIGCCDDPGIAGIENDIMESFHPGKIICHSNHYGGYGEDHNCIQVAEEMSIDLDEYHTFGMLWDEDGYTYYVDGKERGHIAGPVSHTKQFILLSTEVRGYRSELNGPTEEAKKAVGDKFIVDYVRVFDRVK